jgi:aromatic ring-opening dioxygenase LigB subunit
MSEVMQKHYKYAILDFGRPIPHTFPEFARCDHRIVLADSAIWKSDELDRFAKELEKNNIAWDTCRTVCMRGKKSDYARLSRDFGIHVISAPDLRDPFHITSNSFSFFEKILKGD